MVGGCGLVQGRGEEEGWLDGHWLLLPVPGHLPPGRAVTDGSPLQRTARP